MLLGQQQRVLTHRRRYNHKQQFVGLLNLNLLIHISSFIIMVLQAPTTTAAAFLATHHQSRTSNSWSKGGQISPGAKGNLISLHRRHCCVYLSKNNRNDSRNDDDDWKAVIQMYDGERNDSIRPRQRQKLALESGGRSIVKFGIGNGTSNLIKDTVTGRNRKRTILKMAQPSSSSMETSSTATESSRNINKSDQSIDASTIQTEITNHESKNKNVVKNKNTNVNSYYEEYKASMTQVLSNSRIIKRYKIEDISFISKFLLTPDRILELDLPSIHRYTNNASSSSNNNNTNSTAATEVSKQQQFRKELQTQKQNFLSQTNLTTSQYDLAVIALSYLGDHCAKHNTATPLYFAWYKVLEAGMVLRENAMSTFLYVLSSGSGGSATNDNISGDRKAIDIEDVESIPGEVATTHDVLYQPTEKTITLRIKNLVEFGDACSAENLLCFFDDQGMDGDKNENNIDNQGRKKKKKGYVKEELKLRTCLPLLNYYYRNKSDGDVGIENVRSAFKLYHRMRTTSSVLLDSDTYCNFIGFLASQGYFKPGCEAGVIVDAEKQQPVTMEDDITYKNVHEYYLQNRGPELLNILVEEMAQDVLEISNECATNLRNAFVEGFSGTTMLKLGRLERIPYDCQLAPVTSNTDANVLQSGKGELVACRVTVDEASGCCPKTGAKLRLILLEDRQRRYVHDTLLKMADLQFEVYDAKMSSVMQQQQKKKKKKKNNRGDDDGDEDKKDVFDSEYAGRELAQFAEWLDNREGDPFTAIVDGANVAYFGLGSINYHQLKMMVTTLEKMGETPLVVIPQKYVQEKFYLRKGYVQTLTPPELKIINDLTEEGKLYIVPPRCLDDYYWMLSSVSDQTKSRKGADLDVQPENEEGRWPGTRPMLVTNDQMRDHKLELLEPRLFRRWFSCHIVNYNFTPFTHDAWEDREIHFSTADFFSREIQGNPSCIDGEGDGDGGIAWHFPVSDWERGDRFCLRIPSTY